MSGPAPAANTLPPTGRDAGVAVTLTLLWLASTALRFLAGRVVPGPVIFIDEISYWQAARSFHESGQYLVMGEPLGIPNVLYSTLLSPLFALADMTHTYAAAKLIGAALVSSVVFAAYAMAREVLARAESLCVAVLAAAIPGAAYSATIMADNLFYPLLVTTMWLLHRTLVRGGAWAGIAAGVGLITGFFTKPNIAMLAAGYGVTLLLWAATKLANRTMSTRELTPRVLPLLLLAAAIGGRVIMHHDGSSTSTAAFGKLYTNLADASSIAAHFRPIVGLVTVLLLSTLWTPLLDAIGGAISIRRASPARLWFWVLTVSTTAAFVLVVGHYSVKWQTPNRVFERYLYAISPALFAWHFVRSEREPDAFRRVATPALAMIFVAAVLGLWPTLLHGNYAADSPSLTAFAWLASPAVGKPLLATALFALVVIAAAGIGAGIGDTKQRTAAWLVLLVLLNAGWYGWQSAAAPAARETGRLARVILDDLGLTGRVLVVSDSLPRNLIATTSFWLPRGVELVTTRELMAAQAIAPAIEWLVAGRDVAVPLEVAGSLYDDRALIYRNPAYAERRP